MTRSNIPGRIKTDLLKCSCRGNASVVRFERFIPSGTATANRVVLTANRVVLIEFLGKETGHALDTRRNE